MAQLVAQLHEQWKVLDVDTTQRRLQLLARKAIVDDALKNANDALKNANDARLKAQIDLLEINLELGAIELDRKALMDRMAAATIAMSESTSASASRLPSLFFMR